MNDCLVDVYTDLYDLLTDWFPGLGKPQQPYVAKDDASLSATDLDILKRVSHSRSLSL